MLNHPNVEKAPIEGKIVTKKRAVFTEISYLFEKSLIAGYHRRLFPFDIYLSPQQWRRVLWVYLNPFRSFEGLLGSFGAIGAYSKFLNSTRSRVKNTKSL